MRVVNLSRRPFVNDRPVVRLAALLWVLGAVLLAVNITSYTNYWIDSAEIRTELAGIESDIGREQQSFSDLKRRFQRLDLAAMNQQTVFLNGLIRDRTFPWSALFEDLEDVLGFDVKLDTLRPELSDDTPQASVRPPAERRTPTRRRSCRPCRDAAGCAAWVHRRPGTKMRERRSSMPSWGVRSRPRSAWG